jgi:glycine/D-amino acid oxidase-like deaminating enzyme
MLASRVNSSLWAESARRLDTKELAGNKDFDIAIIGGGFSGLWTAYHLNQFDKSLRIAIFEAHEIGFGASGRNGGWASSEYPVTKNSLVKRHGEMKTTQLFEALDQSIDEIGKFARKHAPNAGFVKSGSLYFSRNHGQLARLRAKGSSKDWLSATELKEFININGALGGTFDPSCATVHPFELLQGLARYLIERRVAIYTHSWATQIPGGLLVNSFRIKAPKVIQATEVYGQANREFIPLYSLMIATEPLSNKIWKEIGNRERFTFAENAHVINYAQRTVDNRLAIGGRGASTPYLSKLKDAKEQTKSVHNRLRNLALSWFPILENSKFTHSWGGAVAITRNWEPYLQYDRKLGFGRLGGYAGDGVTMSYLAGKIMAAEVLDRKLDLRNLHFVNQPIKKWEPEPLRYIAVNSLVQLSNLADFEESKSGKPSLLNKVIEPLILR